MKLPRATWFACLWCARGCGTLVLWTLWLLLAGLLAAQLYLLSTRELSLPRPVQEALEKRVAASGLRVTFGKAVFHPSGHVLIRDVRVTTTTQPDPLLTAHAIYFEFDPWLLLAGRFEPTLVEVSGVALNVPAMQSRSGALEALVSDLDGRFRPVGRDFEIANLTARVGNLRIQAHGTLPLPPSRGPARGDASPALTFLNQEYPRLARRISEWAEGLSWLDQPSLELRLTNATAHRLLVDVALQARAFRAPATALKLDRAGDVATGPLHLTTRVTLGATEPEPLRIEASIASLEAAGLAATRTITASVSADFRATPFSFSPVAASLVVDAATARALTAGPFAIEAMPAGGREIQLDVSALIGPTPWRITAGVDPRRGSGRVSLAGAVEPWLIATAGQLAKKDFSTLLAPDAPAPLALEASFDPGWKLANARGTLASGPVRAGKVKLDEAGGAFRYSGTALRVDDMVLRIGDGLAHGSYEMDTASLDYRFLLHGRLRPPAIGGWFRDWWARFWDVFEFHSAPPLADVDVVGRWGDARRTTVFVYARGRDTAVRGSRFDEVETHLFLRPHWFDIFSIRLDKGDRRATGSFERSLDLEKNTWKRMAFDIQSTLDLDLAAGALGDVGKRFAEPYRFTTPPRLTLRGHVDGPGAPRGEHQEVDVFVQADGAASYLGFPLSDPVVQAHVSDSVVDLPLITANVAGGRANGRARVWSDAATRKLAFDVTLKHVGLGEADTLLARYRKPDEPAAADDKLSSRLSSGRIDLALSAEGRYTDLMSFRGSGNADITGAELGKLNLFGALSEALTGSLLNFGSFTLDNARANFAVEGPKLVFSELKITGPSAAIDARGDYRMDNKALNFAVRLYPFNESHTLLGSTVGFVLTPFSNVMEVKLEGTPAKPAWLFALGPTSFFRALTGGSAKTPPTTPSRPPGTPASTPAPAAPSTPPPAGPTPATEPAAPPSPAPSGPPTP